MPKWITWLYATHVCTTLVLLRIVLLALYPFSYYWWTTNTKSSPFHSSHSFLTTYSTFLRSISCFFRYLSVIKLPPLSYAGDNIFAILFSLHCPPFYIVSSCGHTEFTYTLRNVNSPRITPWPECVRKWYFSLYILGLRASGSALGKLVPLTFFTIFTPHYFPPLHCFPCNN